MSFNSNLCRPPIQLAIGRVAAFFPPRVTRRTNHHLPEGAASPNRITAKLREDLAATRPARNAVQVSLDAGYAAGIPLDSCAEQGVPLVIRCGVGLRSAIPVAAGDPLEAGVVVCLPQTYASWRTSPTVHTVCTRSRGELEESGSEAAPNYSSPDPVELPASTGSEDSKLRGGRSMKT